MTDRLTELIGLADPNEVHAMIIMAGLEVVQAGGHVHLLLPPVHVMAGETDVSTLGVDTVVFTTRRVLTSVSGTQA